MCVEGAGAGQGWVCGVCRVDSLDILKQVGLLLMGLLLIGGLAADRWACCC